MTASFQWDFEDLQTRLFAIKKISHVCLDNVHPALTFQQNDGNGLQAIMVKWKNKNSMETLMIVLKKLKQKAVIFKNTFINTIMCF